MSAHPKAQFQFQTRHETILSSLAFREPHPLAMGHVLSYLVLVTTAFLEQNEHLWSGDMFGAYIGYYRITSAGMTASEKSTLS